MYRTKIVHTVVILTCNTVIATVSGQTADSASLYIWIISLRLPMGAHSSRNENDITHNPRNWVIFGWLTDINLFSSSRIFEYILARSCRECFIPLLLIISLVKHFKAAYWLESYTISCSLWYSFTGHSYAAVYVYIYTSVVISYKIYKNQIWERE